MQIVQSLKLLPAEAADRQAIISFIAAASSYKSSSVSGFHILKQSIDARGRQPYINLSVRAFINEPFFNRQPTLIRYQSVQQSAHSAIVIGAGPAGLFAALRLIELGIRPILVERGKNVRARRRDLAILNKEGIINPDSNYCFGEGGAGTYSDGKLYTRSNKRGNIDRILNLFVQFGADEKILYESHPHIGTNKLPQIITAMRGAIEAHGGTFLFEKKVQDLILDGDQACGVKTADGDILYGNAIILATGHSARDIFVMLERQKIKIEAKPFALGVRIEHPQQVIDKIQYGGNGFDLNHERSQFLPPASYSLVQQVDGKGVFSFCMCPGGIIAPASTDDNELVVNGWSPSKRNNPYANSGMVVTCEMADVVKLKDFKKYISDVGISEASPLALMYFQKMTEQKAYNLGGGKFVAPAQRMVDFCSNRISGNLPDCSYLPGLNSVDVGQCLPLFIHKSLQEGLKAFGKKMKGYYTNDAVIVATESRTSSPVRVPRDKVTLQHPQIKNLYPCGEGAGYAGGIVSAAMDGERIADMVAARLIGM